MLPWPALNLHAVYGVLLLGMVLLQTRRTGLADAMMDAADKRALRRQLARAVYLQLYLLFGMSLLAHIAALLWNSSRWGVLHPARLPPPENLTRLSGVRGIRSIRHSRAAAPTRLKRAVAR